MTMTVTGYDIELPTPGQVCVSVMRVCSGDGVERWTQVCARAGVASVADAYSESQLLEISAVLTSMPGALCVVGRALGIRLRAYRTVSARANPSTHPPTSAPQEGSTP